jgi:methylenetetrahydrofolate dehydrogenase (NADP+)/methenyltetrahydrofolate cyclohydrolase
MAKLLKGAPVADAITAELRPRTEKLQQAGIVPTLAIVRVGARDADLAYERGAMKRAAACGIAVRSVVLPETAAREPLLGEIERLNGDSAVHGVLLLRPLPEASDEAAACAALDVEKNVDGITAGSAAGLFQNSGVGFAPCTAQACLELLDYYGCGLAGRRVAVIGRSAVVGRPLALLLLHRSATVTVCHSRTADVPAVTRNAEIVIAAAGHARMVTREYLSAGQTVVDVGIHTGTDGRLCGDVDFDGVEELLEAITPVPGGVGGVTTAVLCKHVVEAAERQSGL